MIGDGQRSDVGPFVVQHGFDFVLSSSLPTPPSGSLGGSSGGWRGEHGGMALVRQGAMLPGYPPQDQPFWRSDTKIHRFERVLDGGVDVLFCYLSEREAKQRIGDATNLVCLLYTSPSPRDPE